MRALLAHERRDFDLGAAAVLWLLAGAALASGIAVPLDRDVSDLSIRFAASRPPPLPATQPDVVIVAIDPQSLRAIDGWPWSRSVYADLVDRLDAAGARSIAFDIDFSTPRDPEGDAAFSNAMRRAGNVVLAAFRQFQTLPGGAELEIASLPAPELAEASAGIGSVHMILDRDGVVRRGRRRVAIGDSDVATLAGAALRAATGRPDAEPGDVASSADPDLIVDYRRAMPGVRTLSLSDVLEARFDPRDIAGRIVLVGATAVELQDLWSTPIGPARPGVWIQALQLRTLAAERERQEMLRTASLPQAWAIVALLLTAGSLLGAWSHGSRGLIVGGLGLAVVGGAFATLQSRGIWLSPVVPLGAIGAQYVVGLERVRSRFGRSLGEHSQSLMTLQRVGEATASNEASGGIGVALALLGDVVDASGVALLRAEESGELDGRRIEWRRRGEGSVGDPDTAQHALASRQQRFLIGELPGGSAARGAAVYAPLFAGERAVGVLVVERDRETPLDDTQLRTVATVGTQVTLSAENLRLIDGLRATFDSSIEAIASAIEARDGYTESHCRRLALFSTLVAERCGLSAEEVEEIRLGALLHDVGKIGIRDEVLLKPTRFTPEERAVMESHTVLGAGIVVGIHGLGATTRACVRNHHERWDGTGYPDRLAVSVVDVWDALSTARPYKPAFEQEHVLDILDKGRGVRFDPEILDVFLRVLDEEGDEMLAVVSGVGRVSA
jgi:CHASE2 domain-containing sensor protein